MTVGRVGSHVLLRKWKVRTRGSNVTCINGAFLTQNGQKSWRAVVRREHSNNAADSSTHHPVECIAVNHHLRNNLQKFRQFFEQSVIVLICNCYSAPLAEINQQLRSRFFFVSDKRLRSTVRPSSSKLHRHCLTSALLCFLLPTTTLTPPSNNYLLHNPHLFQSVLCGQQHHTNVRSRVQNALDTGQELHPRR